MSLYVAPSDLVVFFLTEAWLNGIALLVQWGVGSKAVFICGFFVFFLFNSLSINTAFGRWLEYWGELNNQTLSQAVSSICPRLEASGMPLLPPAPACLIVPVCGCGFTPAPPAADTGQHSRGYLHCTTYLNFSVLSCLLHCASLAHFFLQCFAYS